MENIRVPRKFHLFIAVMATILVIGMVEHEDACITGLIPRPPILLSLAWE